MKKTFVLFVFLLLNIIKIQAQEISLHQGIGGVAMNEPYDGFALYSSVNIKYKFISLSPTFIYYNKNLKKSGKFTWDSNLGLIDNDFDKTKGSIITGNSIRIYFNLYPLSLLNKNSKVDFKIGIGYGFIKEYNTGYILADNNVQFFSEKIRTEFNFMPIVSYTYYIKKIGIGIAMGLDGLVSDEIFYTTINFSLKL